MQKEFENDPEDTINLENMTYEQIYIRIRNYLYTKLWEIESTGTLREFIFANKDRHVPSPESGTANDI